MTFDIIRKNYLYFLVLETEIHLDAISFYDALKKWKKEIKYLSNNLFLQQQYREKNYFTNILKLFMPSYG